jgi:hypothetical protein
VVSLKVSGVTTRVASAVLGQEDAVGVVRPTWAGSANILRAEPWRQATLAKSTSNVIHEAAHALGSYDSDHEATGVVVQRSEPWSKSGKMRAWTRRLSDSVLDRSSRGYLEPFRASEDCEGNLGRSL